MKKGHCKEGSELLMNSVKSKRLFMLWKIVMSFPFFKLYQRIRSNENGQG